MTTRAIGIGLPVAGRADLEAAAAEETPPPDLEARVESAVAACVDTTITSTIPAP